MGIGSISSTSSMSDMQMTTSRLPDQKSKNIQNEISNAKQQMQKLSSKEELSVSEKANERKKLQEEISGLDTKLKQHQEELLRSQKREMMLAKLKEEMQSEKETPSDLEEEKNPTGEEKPGTIIFKNSDGTVILMEDTFRNEKTGTDPEKTSTDDAAEENAEAAESDTAADTGFSYNEVRAMVSADSFLQQADRQGAVAANSKNDIAVLKGEIKQDERLGINTDRKQAELEKIEKREQREQEYQFSILSKANDTFVNDTKVSQREQEEQQKFYVSIG